VSEVHAASIIIALMMVAARTSETSVDNYFTRQYIPEDKSELYIVVLLKRYSPLWTLAYGTIFLHFGRSLAAARPFLVI
jgi:hypothetical protein